MHLAIVTGSHRPQGQSGRLGREIAHLAESSGHTSTLLDLAQVELPFWDEGLWGNPELKGKWETQWAPWAEKLAAADAVVVVAPEYHGMVSSRLKNFLLLVSEGAKPLAYKPGLIVAVSAGISGAYPVAELRAFAAKNNRIAWLPDHLVVRSAPAMLQEQTPPESAEQAAVFKARLLATLDLLYAHAEAVKPLQGKVREFIKTYPNGM